MTNYFIKETVIPKLVKKYRSLLRFEKVDVSQEELFLLANSSYDQAVISFKKLEFPRICDNELAYILLTLAFN